MNRSCFVETICDCIGSPNGGGHTRLTLAVVTAALNAFTNAVADAADGVTVLTAFKNDRRADLVAPVRELANYVQVVCKGDLTVLISSGFLSRNPRAIPSANCPRPPDSRSR